MTISSDSITRTRTSAIGLIAAGLMAASANAQQDQRVFGTYVDDTLPSRISTLSGGDMVSCGNDVVSHHDASGAVNWMLTVEGFYPQASIGTSDGGIAVAGNLINGSSVQCMLV